MNILLLTTWKASCGIATYSSYLCNALTKLCNVVVGYDIHQIAAGTDITQPWNVLAYGLWNRADIFSGNYRSFSRVEEIVRMERITAIHVEHEYGILGGIEPIKEIMLHARKANPDIKLVVTLHAVPIQRDMVIDNLFSNFLIPEISKFIVHTELSKQLLQDRYKWPNDRIEVIPHGCKVINKNTELKRKYGFDNLTIGNAGFIGELKGLWEVIEPLSNIKKKYDLSFIYIGDAHPANRVAGKLYMKDSLVKAKNAGFNPKTFKMTGAVNEYDFDRWMQVPDIFILNYKPSGLHSASGIGARLAGLGTTFAGTGDAYRLNEFEDGKHCLMYSVNDSSELESKLTELIEDTDKRKKLEAGIKQYGLENSWDNIAKRHYELYKEL